MKMSPKGIDLLVELEGFERKKYKDVAGYWTIGVGHLITKEELSSGLIKLKTNWIGINQILNDFEIKELLELDLFPKENCINTYVKVPLAQHQFDALVSFCFNVGVSNFKSSTLLKLLNRKEYDAIPEQFRRWVYAGSTTKVRGLVNRRERECYLWETGKYVYPNR